MLESGAFGEGMGASNITGASEIRGILGTACGNREMLFLLTPYARFETQFLSLDGDAFHVKITMSGEEAMYGLRSPDLHFRFPHGTRFLEGTTRLLGFGLQDGRRTLRLAVPPALRDDEQRRAYRVERVGKVPVTFSTPRFDLKTGTLVNISTSGARLGSPQEPFKAFFQASDSIVVTIPLTEEIRIESRAVVRWVQERAMGVEFVPGLEGGVLTLLSRWVFQRREEDKARFEASAPVAVPSGETPRGIVLVSASQALEDTLRDLLAGLPPFSRVGFSMQTVKEAVAARPALIFLHVQDAGLEGRRRLKLVVETLGGRIPFILVGTQVENSTLFDLGSEHKAAAVYDLSARPGPFFLRLVQGILRRTQCRAERS